MRAFFHNKGQLGPSSTIDGQLLHNRQFSIYTVTNNNNVVKFLSFFFYFHVLFNLSVTEILGKFKIFLILIFLLKYI